MKKNRFTKPLLRRIEPLVRAGIMEEPKWYRAMKETPPYYRRPSNGLKELKLPWDRLANAFADRNPFLIEDPLWLGPNGLKPGEPPLRQRFAKRQYALMQKGVPEEEAYKRVERAMGQERAADVEAIRGMVQQASMSVGARPSFVSDEGVYDGLRQWQAMMSETKYSEWDMAAKVGLDIFLRREVLKYDDMRFKAAETARDGTAESLMAETARLRVALFPESKTDQYECPSNVVAPPPPAAEPAPAEAEADTEAEQDQSGEEAKPVVDEDRVAADEEWTTSMEEYKSLAAQYPFEADWDPETRRRLDAFVMRRCVKRAVLKEVFGWIPSPKSPEENAGATEESTGGDDSQATASTVADLSEDNKNPESYASRISENTTPDFLLGEDGRLDLDFDKRVMLEIDGDVLDEGMGDDIGEADDEEDEGWIMAGEGELSETGFDVDWMAAAKHRVGDRSETVAPTRKRRGSAKEAQGSPQAKLRRNLELVLNQAKRQLLPELKLVVDEQGATPEEWLAKLQATKKNVMVNVKREAEEMDKQRLALHEKVKRDFGEPEGMPWHYGEQRLKPGVSKSERRRLRRKEKLAFKEYQASVHERLSGKVPEQRLKEIEEEEAKALERLLPTFKEHWEMDEPSGNRRSYPAKRSKPVLWRTPPLPNQQEYRKRKH